LPYSLVINLVLALPSLIFGFSFGFSYFSIKFAVSLCSCFFFFTLLFVSSQFPKLFSLVFFSHSICICCHFALAFISCCLVILLTLVLCVVSLVLNPPLFSLSCILYSILPGRLFLHGRPVQLQSHLQMSSL